MGLLDLFRLAVKKGASDVIITAGEAPIYRVRGTLWSEEDAARLTPDETKSLVFSILREDQKIKLEKERELDFSVNLRALARFRGNCFYQRGTVGAVFRRISDEIPALENLGLPQGVFHVAEATQGLMLVTGPSGSGKSTTLAAIIERINNRRKVHIVTVEDPIEYVYRNKNSVIEQREVGEDTHSFQQALRHVLRQDPDVVLIGELRDLDTIATAVTAAETGHLVLATLHTVDCVQSIDRMIDVFPANQQFQVRCQLAASLLAVLNQRLMQRHDKVGQVVAAEFLVATDAVRAMIREGKNHQIYSLMETGLSRGMQTMDQALSLLHKQGKIAADDARGQFRSHRELTVRSR